MCGPVAIEGEVRELIAAMTAVRNEVSSSPFGPDDEIGMLSLLERSNSREILHRVDTHEMFDLSVDLFIGMPTWTAGGEPPFSMWMVHNPRGSVVDDPVGVGHEQNELVAWSGDAISMFTHCGTHIDTLNHFGYKGAIWNNFRADDHLGSLHWTVAGADKQPPIIGRGVMIDVAKAHGLDVLPDSYGITSEDLSTALDDQDVELCPGDIVLVRTGRGGTWPDPGTYLPAEPGLTRESAEFLAKSGAVVVGADNIAVEQLPSSDPGNWMGVHTYLLAEAGIPMMEVVDLEGLSAAECYEFAFIGAGLKIRGATAGPMRPLAFRLSS